MISDTAFSIASRLSQSVEQHFAKNLKAAIENGELSSEVKPKSLAKLLLSIDQGLSIYGITHPSTRGKTQLIDLMLERVLGGA